MDLGRRIIAIIPRRLRMPAAAGAFTTLGLAAWFWLCLPDPLFTAPVSSVLVSADGSLLGAKIADDGQWRFPARDAVPEKFAAAVVAYEDKRFYKHPGVDPFALARAAYLNAKFGRIVSGGSTITVQVIRLARGGRRRTYGEKLIEMIWALRLELESSKQEILALYAAHAPFGGNVVGLEAAAWRYFGRTPDALSWAEASMLAVLPNSPALIHPGRNRDQLQEKRDSLLSRLQQHGVISTVTLRASRLEPLPDRPQPLPQEAPHLLETLSRRDSVGRHRFESTIVRPVQRAVQDAVNQNAAKLELMRVNNLAAIVIDNQQFHVLAYIGNSRWATDDARGSAIDLVHRPRSTGSVLKPLLFARMLDAGEILPQTLIPDLPTRYGGYMPENYDRQYRGAVPARQALARSLNVPAVRMLRRHGVDRFYDFLTQAGMSTLHRPPGEYGLTLILGGAEGTLWDMSALYANLAYVATRGAHDQPVTYHAPIVLRNERPSTDRTAGMSVGAAWLTIEALIEVTRPGIEETWRRFAGGQPIAWKTGTSFGQRDGWAIGSTAKYTVGVWAGNATGEGRPGLTGVGTAAPLLFDIFDRLDPASWPDRPVFALRSVDVCRTDGYLPAGDCETETAWMPRDSHFDRTSPHQRLVHLDATRRWRVHGNCESVDAMTHATWFVLPAGQEFYYRTLQTSYRELPPYRSDCRKLIAPEHDGVRPLDFLYPSAETRIYIPIDLDGERGRVVFEVAHRDPKATVFWHLNDRYVGATSVFHEQAMDLTPGRHTLTVVDANGNRISREIDVLEKEGASLKANPDHERPRG